MGIHISHSKSLIGNLYAIVHRYKYSIMKSLLFSIIISSLSVISPILSQKIIDEGIVNNNVAALISYVLIIILLFITVQAIIHFQTILQLKVHNNLSLSLSSEAFSHALRLRVRHLKETGLYKLINDANYHIQALCRVASDEFWGVAIEFFKIIGVSIGLFFISWKLTLFVLAILPIKFLLIWMIDKWRSKYVLELIEANRQLSLWLNDIFEGIYEVKLWNMTEEKEQEYAALLSRINSIELKKYRIDRIKQGINAILENSFLNIIYILGGFLIWREEFTIGGIIAFISYSNYLIEPMTLTLELKILLSEIKPSLKAYIDFMNLEEEEIPNDSEAIEYRDLSPGFIEFRDVSFSYQNDNTLHHIDLKIQKGEKVAFIGRNGSGKTTLINLLLRFYEPSSGNIYMDHHNINHIPLKEYRNLFSVMQQSSFLFNTSIWDNLTMFGKVELERNQLELEDQQNRLLDFTSRLPHQFETKVGLNGSMLSGGEKQKLIFSRAIRKKSKILILDEVTSNYDSHSERQFEEIIEHCTAFDFMILITHRVNVLQKVDRIVLLDEGRIVSVGSFQELYQEQPMFREIIHENSILVKGDFAHEYHIQNI
ncbi:hypothetical protein DCC85_03875 [Paenibacillus sp. CAA11]|uniref:ABC transporter ATP-binding protein n=1 Tax=Paenibacillus sp. CAA11 TaxID=1532905 RepID=UPI000D3D3E82|nr:ABC transporter ATP-binding protein [Paenibacillus sp. CAA11]AWB43445.1 hypothetical protein DCC85_03875 [Paenibacillus sp. CAA11]